MRLKDMLWPWGRVIELEQQLSITRGDNRSMGAKLAELSRDRAVATAKLFEARAEKKLTGAHLERLYAALKVAHFRGRNGRLLKRGVVPPELNL